MKRFFALLIAIMVLFTIPTSAMAAEASTRTNTANEDVAVASSTYVMATFYDYEFYTGTDVKQIYLEKFCVSITYRCATEDGSYDAMHLIITDLNGNGYDQYITLDGDNQSHTLSLYLPAGYYAVQITGNVNHFHTAAAVNFYGYV